MSIRTVADQQLICAFCGKPPGWPSCSNTHAKSRQSIQPPQAGQRMKCSASLLGGLPTCLPKMVPRGTLHRVTFDPLIVCWQRVFQGRAPN